jgi:hypothetical protein
VRDKAPGRVALALLTALAVAALTAVVAATPASAAERFIPPVDGRIIQPFKAPLSRFSAGHRGIDFGVPAGTQVVASGPGRVKFAGQVADDGLFVTISHSGDVETTYSFLSRIDVKAGMEVASGEVIGASGAGHPGSGVPALHFGAKFQGRYIDPELLLNDLSDITDLIALAPIEEPPPAQEFGPLAGSASIPDRPAPEAAQGDPTARTGRQVVPVEASSGGSTKPPVAKNGLPLKAAAGRLNDSASFLPAGPRDDSAPAQNWQPSRSRSPKPVKASKPAVPKKGFAEWLYDSMDYWGPLIKPLAKGSVTAYKAGRDLFLRAEEKSRESSTKLRHQVGSFLDTLPPVQLGQMLWKEGGCIFKKAAPLPNLPSAAQLKAGAKPPPPPNDNILVAVTGINTSTEADRNGQLSTDSSLYKVDWQQLGYSDDHVYYYSYGGVESRPDQGHFRLHKPYSKEDSLGDLNLAARKLRDLVNEVHSRHPGKDIDIVAHSQGGVVAEDYVTWLYDPDNPLGVHLGHLVTISSPHTGADLAAAHSVLADTEVGKAMLAEAAGAINQFIATPPPSSIAVRELAEHSPFMKKLSAAWDPTKVPTTTIGTPYDIVVAPQHTRLPGAEHFTATFPTRKFFAAHSEVLKAQTTHQYVYNALADKRSKCTLVADVVADFGSGRQIATVEDGFVRVLDLISGGPKPADYIPRSAP